MDILSGKTAVVKGELITGTGNNQIKTVVLGSNTQDTKSAVVLSYNVSSYSGYQYFTVNNFVVDVTNMNIEGNSGITNRYSGGISKSYNPTTGIITITKPAINHPSGWFMSTMQVDVKLIYT